MSETTDVLLTIFNWICIVSALIMYGSSLYKLINIFN